MPAQRTATAASAQAWRLPRDRENRGWSYFDTEAAAGFVTVSLMSGSCCGRCVCVCATPVPKDVGLTIFAVMSAGGQ